MSDIWMQIRDGNAVDMVHPVYSEVHFVSMCRSLADINRYAGGAKSPVSVAFHTLIGLDILVGLNMAGPDIVPYWLLHDAHEERLGDEPTPAQLALAVVAGELFNGGWDVIREAQGELRRRHDRAIWDAAGLPPPTRIQQERVRWVDRVALATECRDFLDPPPKDWGVLLEIEPSSTRYTPGYFGKTPGDVAIRLLGAMRCHLPVFLNASTQRAA